MTTLHAEPKAAAPKPRDQRTARDAANSPEDRAAPRTRTAEAIEHESYNLPFTD